MVRVFFMKKSPHNVQGFVTDIIGLVPHRHQPKESSFPR